jgi:hypothetical protein
MPGSAARASLHSYRGKTVTEQTLHLHDLSFVSEGDEVVVGRLETGSYAVFPADGAELLRRLGEGMPMSQASAWYEGTFGGPVDIDDFAVTLAGLGFVREPGAEWNPAGPVRLQRLGRALFSPPAWACYAAIIAGWLFAASRTSAMLPHPSQFYFTASLVIVQAAVVAAQVPLLFLHEGFHVLAGRRLGLPTRVGVSNRLIYVVFETQLNGLNSLPRRARYLPFLAGLLCDGVLFCALGLIAELTRPGDGSYSLAGRFCLALAFTVAVRMAWQFQLYLRTDLYYVFATALNCHDLHGASTALLRNRIWRALGRTRTITDQDQWTEHDRRVAALYGPFIVLGIAVMMLITAFGSFPVARQYFATITRDLAYGPLNAHFWDGLGSLSFNVAQIVALIVLSRRKRGQRAGRRPEILAGRKAD